MSKKRLTPIERLARDICWNGFGPAGKRGKTMASYWKSLPETSREIYRSEAKTFAHILRHVDVRILNDLPQ